MRILDRLDAIVSPEDMDIPGWGFHELKGNRKGVFSLEVRKNWKITFRFEMAMLMRLLWRIIINEYFKSQKS